MTVFLILLPVAAFLALLLFVGLRANQKVKSADKFQSEYFLGSRSLGGVVLAMTLVATYGSVSTYVSGPGLAWGYGLGWVVFAAPQIITGFLILGVLGKKMAVLSRRTNSLTVIDLIYARFNSRALCVILSLVLLIFFSATIVGQFVGGAQIFAAITGLDYKIGLIMFAVVTVLYTAGGFRAVVLTDAVCAVLMLTGMFLLGGAILSEGGGLEAVCAKLAALEPTESGQSKLFTFNAGGALPLSLLFSAWLLVGFCTVGLPQSMVRCMSYKSTEALHQAMIVATIICGALMIGLTLLGVFARAVVTELPAGGSDAIIPLLIAHSMHPLLSGITIIGPLAATMSTVSSLLIAASSAIVRDLYLQLHGHECEDVKARKFSSGITLVLGIICILLAMYPMDIVVWINLFAFGGLESAFLWPMFLGLFVARMNKEGALASVICGLGVYIVFSVLKVNIAGFHNIVWGCAAGLIAALVVMLLRPGSDRRTMEIFFPHKLPR